MHIFRAAIITEHVQGPLLYHACGQAKLRDKNKMEYGKLIWRRDVN